MATNGSGARKCPSWIAEYVKSTDNLEAPELFRQWAGISTIAATLEQKVWVTTSSPLYPNLYVFLIGHPGTGKTRTIRVARQYLRELPDAHIAPVSMTFASLVDALLVSKRMIIRLPDGPLEYNSMTIAADELGTFIHKYDKEMVDGLSAFYDIDPYGQNRRGNDIKIKIKSPQLNILCGSTPSNLMELMPEGAWGQGFTSRIIFVFSDERAVGDDFASTTRGLSKELEHDLKIINSVHGEFAVTEDYRNLVNLWRQAGELPAPAHPKLIHYNTRRRVHLYKLSMVAAIDRSNTLLLTRDDFNRAMNWLVNAEQFMSDIFQAGAAGGDSQAMDEIKHFVMTEDRGKGISEHRIVNYARERVPAHSVMRVLEIMERAGMLHAAFMQKGTGLRFFKTGASPHSQPHSEPQSPAPSADSTDPVPSTRLRLD